MPKRLNFHLDQASLKVISRAIKHDKRPEVRQRAMGLRLLHQGQSAQEVAEFMSVSLPVVYEWHHRWQREELDGLANRPKSGRTRKATAAYVALLAKVIDQDPQAFGYAFTIWTIDRLRLHMEAATGILLGQTQFRRLLKEQDFVYRRPKHELTNLQDPQARQTAEAWLDELKKAPKRERSSYSLWTKAA
jgi:transposase